MAGKGGWLGGWEGGRGEGDCVVLAGEGKGDGERGTLSWLNAMKVSSISIYKIQIPPMLPATCPHHPAYKHHAW